MRSDKKKKRKRRKMEEKLSADRRVECSGCSIRLRDNEKCLELKRQSANDACEHCRRVDFGCAWRAVHAADHRLCQDVNEMMEIQLRNKAEEKSASGAVRNPHAAWDREEAGMKQAIVEDLAVMFNALVEWS
ncbi:uncharacterized protein MONOS_14572 [Monocercomonoides exilis]|uniref:uncharacterized protein n=1 Tax=Monocercomonoides exilis TaxID=2049356 RepID=UPI00355A030D|nr:hypothetical protein MONOS_14572 [Monocercomonoides exilis]|eukprot:MONOS_14572.1-p1 / transcript=MONOS_14572.1 / gene=MONOS_14572 / organism=Monocercomonoides_exilis_PA203 / gene_product=unspecified product / transcript_product=unspecified product / location=Mono_scaffold01026:4734-5129(-) / protein_length=132 / sequence_SO=supercontig / SO=protein_coding / is_pseudo=false